MMFEEDTIACIIIIIKESKSLYGRVEEYGHSSPLDWFPLTPRGSPQLQLIEARAALTVNLEILFVYTVQRVATVSCLLPMQKNNYRTSIIYQNMYFSDSFLFLSI